MSRTLNIAMAQLNPIVGDVRGNLEKAVRAHRVAEGQGADLVVFSELFLSGYPPEDLVLNTAFQDACLQALTDYITATAESTTAGLIGLPLLREGSLYNAMVLTEQGEIRDIRAKYDLPNYSVFDEKRVFHPGALPDPVTFRGVQLGVPVCEDMWNNLVCTHLARRGAEMLVVPNGSPFHKGKHELRLRVIKARQEETPLPLIYVNQVGGQDELVFDGGSMAVDADGIVRHQSGFLKPSVETVTLHDSGDGWQVTDGGLAAVPCAHAQLYGACMLGLRDYVEKNGFKSVVLGLSGGIDSALCAAIAVDALGPDRVHTIMLPYRYTSRSSLDDAMACATALGIRHDTVSIAGGVEGVKDALGGLFSGLAEDVTEENLQSRMRGVILMAISNKFGSMVVTTGNKSEMSVGYATLYGDMNGGFNPIKDLYKMEVYALARWRNENQPDGALGPRGDVIPHTIIMKAPSAELRDNQTDQDSLPPYPVLDAILEMLVEEDMGVDEVCAKGFEKALVLRIAALLRIAEYKRRQSAPGVKVTRRSFGRDRRYPITNGFRQG